MKFKIGDVVEVLPEHNSRWCGVGMEVVRFWEHLYVICLHPERGEGAFMQSELIPSEVIKSPLWQALS